MGDDQRRTALAGVILGGLMVVLGIVVMVQALRLDGGGLGIGPATVPWVVSGLLFVVGVLVALRSAKDLGAWRKDPQTSRPDWKRAAVLLGVLVAFAVVVPYLGYVVATTLLFGTVAVVLGAPSRIRAYVYGWCVAVAVFLAFDVGIGISLPAGPWGF